MEERKKRKHIIKISLAAMLVMLVFTVFAAPVSAAELHVGSGQTYSTIQAAIDAASPGDTIIVHDGTYNENVDVDKSNLTIRSQNGSDVTTVIAFVSNDHVFDVTEDYVNISGFTVTGATIWAKAGIYLGSGTDHCNISGNNASNNDRGIHLDHSSDNTLTNNIANSNDISGITLSSSSNNTLTDNTANSNTNHGIALSPSSNNTLTNNTANSNDISGIILATSSNNTLTDNTALNNTFGIELTSSSNYNTLINNTANLNNTLGIYVTFSSNYNTLTVNTANLNDNHGIYLHDSNHNTLTNNTANSNYGDGIRLFRSSNNTLTNNTANSNYDYGICLYYPCKYNTLTNNTANSNSNYDGIYLSSSSSNTLANNTVNSNNRYGINLQGSSKNNITNSTINSNGDYGIYLEYSDFNIITGNNASNNAYGIYLKFSDGNLLYNNYFNNTNNAYDTGNWENSWNITKTAGTNIIGGPNLGGNYWSDYDGWDENGDGLGDTKTPYNSSGNIQDGGDWHPLVPVGIASNCTCGDICVNESGWWRADGIFNPRLEPIWAAVNSSAVGETICVKDGTYNENVDVTKSHLTIRSENGSASTIVQAADSGDYVFGITEDYVNISGFTATGATGSYGIYLRSGTDHCNISDNCASNNNAGIFLNDSSNNSLTNNNASNNAFGGIFLRMSSSSNVLRNNTANENSNLGIFLVLSSNYNTLTNNTANLNGNMGIGLLSSRNSTLTNNTANENYMGIYVYTSNNNSLTNNTASNNTEGDFYSDQSSHNNTVEDLTIASYPTTISFTYDNGIELKGVDTAPGDPTGKVNINKYVDATDVSADSWLFLNVSYSDADISGVQESTLRMWKNNGSWYEVEGSGVNEAENYVYANITEFSIFAPLGSTATAGLDCTCGDICVNETGWWRDGDAFQTSLEPIWAAVNSSAVGETICVKDGTYNENVDVTKSNLTIRSENGSASTIVQAANPGDHVFEVTANNVTIAGFTVTGATDKWTVGIYLNTVEHCNISNNIAKSNNWAGIRLQSSSNNTIANNTVNSNDDMGISLYSSSSNNRIENNTAINNTHGIMLRESSSNNKITDNNASLSHTFGIRIESNSQNNTITGNTASSNSDTGISLHESTYNNTLSGNTANENNRDGIKLDSSSNNSLQNNTANENNWVGIRLDSSSNNSLQNNNASNNLDHGIGLYSSSNNSLQNNIANENIHDGIRLDSSSNNSLQNNTANENNWVGTRLDSSNNNSLQNNIANENGDTGIRLDSPSNNNMLQNNTANENNWFGILLCDSSNNSLQNNKASNNVYGNGIKLDSSSNNHLIDNNASSNSQHGIFLDVHSTDNLLEYNTAYNNTGVGIIIRKTSNKNSVTKNIVTENGKGIQILESASNNTVIDNEVYANNGAGIEITVSAHNNSIIGNKIRDNTGGGGRGVIVTGSSNNNSITDNLLENNSVAGIQLESDSNNSMVINNTVIDSGTEGIAVWTQNNVITDNRVWNSSNAGIILSSSSKNMVANNTVKNKHGWPAILLSSSSYNQLVNNTVSDNNGDGIKLESDSNYNQITGNNASDNEGNGIALSTITGNNYNDIINNTVNLNKKYGIYLKTGEAYNNIINNTVLENERGICLESAWNNNISDNNVSHNDIGIYLTSSISNTIYNNYFNNTNNAYDDDTNTWNLTAKLGTSIIGGPYLGGNYWSDYDGWDENSDGLGDTKTPYNSSGNIQTGGDYLPLTAVLDLTAPASVSDLNETDTGTTWLLWNWTNPTDADFNHTEVYIDGVKANVYAPDHEYNATGLSPNTLYEIGTRTVDNASNVNQTWMNDTATTLVAPDTTPPASVSDLNETDTGTTWLLWNWTNPTDADFNHTEVYIDGVKINVYAPDHEYNATGLSPSTLYEIGTRTVDNASNVNQTWMNDTATTLAAHDTTPPASVSDLNETDTGTTWLLWNWTNPTDADFNHTEVYIDGVKINVYAPDHEYNATGLSPSTLYEIGTRTVDNASNVNQTWMNDTATTLVAPDTTPPASVSDLNETDTGTTWLLWNWTNPTDADFNHTEVYIDGVKINVYAPDHEYNATGLSPSTLYEIGTRTVDNASNVNQTWMNDTATTLVAPDTTPPASVSDLNETDTGTTWLLWNWTNPTDADFNHTEVYIDGVKINVYAPDHEYNATGLSPNTLYEIGTRTVDNASNVNQTWMNDTATTLVAPDTTPPASVSDLNETDTGTTWLLWNWTNPTDVDFNHTEVYIDGVKINVYAPNHEYNATGLTPSTLYEIGTRTVDNVSNVNQTWMNDTAKTLTAAEDTIPPVIESVTLDAYTTIPDATIHVTVEATDNVGVTAVTADSTVLVDTGSTWEGNITAPSTTGDYTLNITAEDAVGNSNITTVDYSVVKPSGSIGIGVDPRLTTVTTGNTAIINLKLVSTENFDDIAYVYLTTAGVYPGYEANLTWFNCTSKYVKVPKGAVVNVPLEVTIPAGESGYKVFYAKLESTKWTPTAMDTGILYITPP